MKPLEAFEANIADAHQLVSLAEGLTNQRTRRMRTELRAKVGTALGISERDRGDLDCLESSDAFVVFLPGARLGRSDLDDLRPLLRQALVAACAAAETYVHDKVMEKVGSLLRSSHAASSRLKELPLTLGTWLEIEERYEKKRWGLREHVVQPYVREHASTAPNKVGIMLSIIGVTDWAKKLDGLREVTRGGTVGFLGRVTERRNRIAHQGDRVGRGRAHLTVEEVRRDISELESVVHAIETLAASQA